MRILPRQEKFFEFFASHAACILRASELLLEGVRAGNSHLPEYASQIKGLEDQADRIIHDLVEKLSRTFITPLDPEDIHRLSGALDDVMDGIEDCAHRLAAHGVDPVPPAAVRLCELVHQSALEIQRAVSALQDDRPVNQHWIEINRLENEADHIYREAVADLLRHETNAILLIKQKELFEYLEETMDRTEDVADVLQNVVVKNS
jgi:uncharacterized protein Yka (UPF0111/DUF47 family)